jgi:hypothetical protein
MPDDLKIKDPDVSPRGHIVTNRLVSISAKHRGLEIRDGISIV